MLENLKSKWNGIGEKVAAGTALIVAPVAAMAQAATFEETVFDALTAKVTAVATAAGPYVALILGIYLVYKMVRRFS